MLSASIAPYTVPFISKPSIAFVVAQVPATALYPSEDANVYVSLTTPSSNLSDAPRTGDTIGVATFSPVSLFSTLLANIRSTTSSEYMNLINSFANSMLGASAGTHICSVNV